MTAMEPLHQRIEELRILRATSGLSPEEASELARLLEEAPPGLAGAEEDAAWERTAAAVDLAFGIEETPLPPELRRRVAADAEAFFGEEKGGDGAPTEAAVDEPPDTTGDSVRPFPGRRQRLSGQLGWWAAAACLAFALVAGWWNLAPTPMAPPPDYGTQATLLADQPGARVLPWTATDDAAASAAAGEVVWSPAEDRGFMRIRGLEANDPSEAQYQLWIFDRQRDERFPVDGGVFDVTGDEVVVPIDAKLPVGEAYLFAITVESPGGVVVSDRERIVLVAQAEA